MAVRLADAPLCSDKPASTPTNPAAIGCKSRSIDLVRLSVRGARTLAHRPRSHRKSLAEAILFGKLENGGTVPCCTAGKNNLAFESVVTMPRVASPKIAGRDKGGKRKPEQQV